MLLGTPEHRAEQKHPSLAGGKVSFAVGLCDPRWDPRIHVDTGHAVALLFQVQSKSSSTVCGEKHGLT
jgi:hypothetical protein